MSCQGTITIGSTSALTSGIYEFGRSSPNSQSISNWQNGNVFSNLGVGVYRWEVRRKVDLQTVKVGYLEINQKNNCGGTISTLDYGLYLHPINILAGQNSFQLPVLALKYKFVSVVVNNIEYEQNSEFRVENGQVIWNELFPLEVGDKIRVKYLFVSQL